VLALLPLGAAAQPSLGTTTLLEGPGAGSDSVVLAVAAPTNTWTAAANDAWLHLDVANQSGAGSTNVVFSYDTNSGAIRTGTLTIAGQTLTVTQAGSTYVAAPGPLTALVASGLNEPEGVAVGGAGNVYIADTDNNVIKEWTAANNSVTTLVVSGLSEPCGVAADGAGNVYIADYGYSLIKEWTAANNILTTLVGSGLNLPEGVAVDGASNVYIADTRNNAIKKWTAANNTVTTLVASGLNFPTGVAVDGVGNVYIADTDNNVIKEWTAANNTVTTLVSSGLSYPTDVAVDGAGNVYIADSNNNAIKEWTAANNTVTTLAASGLSYPIRVAVDAARNVYVADWGNNAIKELPRAFVDPTGKLEGLAAGRDVLPVVLPATANLLAPFAPTSDQAWLTITGITNGVVSFAFDATTSNRTAHITLLGQPIFITQFAGISPTNLTASAGSPAIFTAGATGENLSYQWQVSGDGGITFTNTSATDTNASYTNLVTTLAESGYEYQVIVSTTGLSITSAPPSVLTVNAPATASAGGNQTVCAGQSTAPLGGSVGGAATGGIWTSSSSTGSFSSNTDVTNATYTDASPGTVTLTLHATGQLAPCVATAQVVVTVNALPAVANPPTNLTVCAGSPAVFSVGTAGQGLSYQWQVSGDGGITFTNISATATNASYTNLVTSLAQSGYQYQVIVSGACSPPATSTQAVLTVNAPATASAGGNQTICAGHSTAALDGVVGGGATGGVWSSSGTGTFSNPNDVTNATYTPSPADITNGTVTLTLSTTGQGAPCTLATAQVVLTINGLPAISAQPTNLTVCAGSRAVFSVGATGAGLTYQWQVSGDGGITFTNISATATNASYTNLVTSLAQTGYQYQVIVSGACSPPATSTQAVLTVNAPATASAGGNQTICAGHSTAPLGGVIGGGATGGVWSSSGTGTFSNPNDVTNATYIPSPADITAGTVTLTLSTIGQGAPCTPATAQVVLTINGLPAISAQPTNLTVCAGSRAVLSVGATGAGLTYQWQVSGDGGITFTNISATATNASYTNPVASLAQSGYEYRVIVSGACSPPATSTQAVLTIYQPGTASAGANQTICAGHSTAALRGVIGGGATGGVWSSSGTGTFSNRNDVANATYIPSSADITAGGVTLTLTTQPCGDATAQVALTINPTPPAPTTSGSVSTPGSPAALSASGTGGTLNWYSDPGLTTLVNTGTSYAPTLSSTTTYYVTETSASGCVSTASPVTATIISSLFGFAIFYNNLLEFTWCAPMTINGHTHANGDIYTGSAWQLTFNGLVTTTGTISSPPWDGFAVSNYTAAPTFSAGYSTNRQALVLPIGTNNLHAIIDLPPNGEDPNSALGQQRYYNKAGLILLVSNSTVTLTLKSTPVDPQATSVTACYYPTNLNPSNYIQVTTNFPFLTITNTFTDQRESKLVEVTDIDVGKLSKWLVTNATVNAKFPNGSGLYNTGSVPNILYAGDNRTYTNGQLTAIRLKNGAIIPTNMVPRIVVNCGLTGLVNQASGFTVATPNPLYVWGNYNCPNTNAPNTTNTTSTFPASLISDALTILSPNWVDSQSSLSLSSGKKNAATSDAVNAAILAGNVPSTGSSATQYSGGVHNLPRLLENWGNGGSVTLTLNTSLANLFASARATNQFQSPGVYYYAPTRQFSFNQNFSNPAQLPPGTPSIVTASPVITVPPQGQTVSAGQTAVFSVVATGNLPLAYQWRFDGTNIPNATSTTLTITNASARNAGSYSVVVTNGFGSQTSSNALLTVNYPPVINAQPISQTVSAGQTAVFNVVATGSLPLAYQWCFNGTNIWNATNSTLTVTNASAGNAGFYSVVVTNAFGSQTSSNALLTVNYPPVINAQPVTQAALPGSVVTFSVSAGGTVPLSYQWTFNGSPIAGATNASLVITGVQSNNTGSYSVVVTNAAGSVTSSLASLFLANAPDFLWARSASNGAPAASSAADGVAADVFGNILVAGWFETPTLDFGGGVLTNSSWAGGSIANFICSYDGAGNLLWVRPAGTNSGFAWPLRVGTDASGNAYLAGRFAGTGTFGTNTLVSSTPADLFVAKYDSQGQVLWVRQIGAYQTVPASYYFGFAVDPGGNAFIACRDGGSANFGAVTLTNSAAFLAKYDNAGNLVWAQEALGADAIAVGTNGAVCLTGKPGLLAKYDNQGTLVWSNSFPVGQAIVLDAQESIFTTGYGAGTYDGFTLTNSGGSPDCFTAKCDAAGQLQWLRQVGGVQQQQGMAIGLDEYGSVYVTSVSAVARPEPVLAFGTTVLTNVFTFVAKYDPAGYALWARAPAMTNRAAVFALAVKDSADAYLGGYFSGTAAIGALTLSNAYPCSGSSFSDPCSLEMFVAKLDGAEAAGLPMITAGPQDQVVMAGSDVTFSVTVPSGIPLSYQWFYDQTNAIAGATGSSLFLSSVQATEAGNYSVTVSNACGSVNSGTASLTVWVAPAITAAPQSLTLLVGQDAVFNVAATGTEPLVYQWQFNGTNLVDATNATLILTNVTTDQAGVYGVTVTNLAGIASTSATFCVYSSAAAILTAPPSFTGDGFQFTITGVPGFNYAVEGSTNLVDWVPLSTNTSPFTFADGDATNFPVRYYRSVYLP
jgi:hypothetical protein